MSTGAAHKHTHAHLPNLYQCFLLDRHTCTHKHTPEVADFPGSCVEERRGDEQAGETAPIEPGSHTVPSVHRQVVQHRPAHQTWEDPQLEDKIRNKQKKQFDRISSWCTNCILHMRLFFNIFGFLKSASTLSCSSIHVILLIMCFSLTSADPIQNPSEYKPSICKYYECYQAFSLPASCGKTPLHLS